MGNDKSRKSENIIFTINRELWIPSVGKICGLKITSSGDIPGKSSFLSAPLVSMVWIRVGRGGGVTEIELLKWGLRRMTKVLLLIIRSVSGCSSPNFHNSLPFGIGSLQLQFQNKNTSVYLPRMYLCMLFYPNLSTILINILGNGFKCVSTYHVQSRPPWHYVINHLQHLLS